MLQLPKYDEILGYVKSFVTGFKRSNNESVKIIIKIKNILKSELSDSELSKLGNLAFDFISWWTQNLNIKRAVRL